jgi:hypothetical protein
MFWWEKLEGKGLWVALSVHERIILKWILKK